KYSVDPDLPHAADWENVYHSLLEKYPDFTFQGIEIPPSPARPYNFLFFHNSEGGFKAQLAFVNPINGAIMGEIERNNTFSNFLRQIHVRLYDGWYGRQIVGLAGIALVISTITGLMIYGTFMKKQL